MNSYVLASATNCLLVKPRSFTSFYSPKFFVNTKKKARLGSRDSNIRKDNPTDCQKTAFVVKCASPPTLTSSVQIADALFTLATAAVMPIYSAMLFAPKRPLTKKIVESPIPYIILGSIYIYLFCLSFTPETLKLMFSSQYWLPELSGITRMFSSILTVASAWVHLIVVDLFAARQVYLDGIVNDVETRHSLVLCLMFGPIGIMCHSITKALLQSIRKGEPTSSNT